MKNIFSRSLLLLLLASFAATGCGLLDVSDPTVVEESDLANPSGAELLRRKAISELYNAVAYSALFSAMASDEYFAFPSKATLQSGAIWRDHLLDQRALRSDAAYVQTGHVYTFLQTTRLNATYAINWYRQYGSAAQRPNMGQLLAVRGYTSIGLAEQVCTGFALHDVVDDRPVFGKRLSVDEVLASALVDLDSAVIATQDSARFLNLARVTRGRALLGLGRFDEAADAVKDVPVDFVYNAEFGPSPGRTNLFSSLRYSATGNNVSVADREGGIGMDFASANDPRVEVTPLGTAHDGTTKLYGHKKSYTVTNASIVLASGIEARLIMAEAALRDNDPNWLTILNDLRTHPDPKVAPVGLTPLVDPGTPDARLDLLYRERAFWLFGSGRRLGDMRRLVRVYGRAPEAVFPTGAYHTGGTYASNFDLPFIPYGEDTAGSGVTGCID